MKKYIFLLALATTFLSCVSDDENQRGFARFQKAQFEGSWTATSITSPTVGTLNADFTIEFDFREFVLTFDNLVVRAPYMIIEDKIIKSSQTGVDDFYFIVNSVDREMITMRMVYGLPGQAITNFFDIVLERIE